MRRDPCDTRTLMSHERTTGPPDHRLSPIATYRTANVLTTTVSDVASRDGRTRRTAILSTDLEAAGQL
jgi:hypothetical protein